MVIFVGYKKGKSFSDGGYYIPKCVIPTTRGELLLFLPPTTKKEKQ